VVAQADHDLSLGVALLYCVMGLVDGAQGEGESIHLLSWGIGGVIGGAETLDDR
jgi:hypothetical protein